MTKSFMSADEQSVQHEARDRTKVLLVDDEPSLTNLFKMVIHMELPQLQIDTAGNGIEALELFSLNHHGVLVMDLHMPLMDGHTTFREIKKMCETRGWEMPSVVFCTGYAPPDTLKAIFIESAEHCVLSKPISPDAVTNAVKSRL